MVKSVGSISQVPALPRGAAVVIFTSSVILTWAALVSIKPPLSPFGALASSVPLTFTVPDIMPPSRTMVPFCPCNACASITPVLLTTLASSASLAPAFIKTLPPSARIRPPFSARLLSMLWPTCMFTRLLFWKVRVVLLPAPSATVPNGAVMLPWLLTVLLSSAT